MARHESILAGLDEWQREAAMSLRGPVAILAGAGTGKTRTITHRIAYGVLTGTYAPERVMAVSFTKKAAGELQERLHQLGVQGVQTRTFHSAALQQLSYFWPQTVGGEAPKIITSKIQILNQVLSQLAIELDKESTRDLASEIEWKKVSLLDLNEYESAIIERPTINGINHDQIFKAIDLYEETKRKRHSIDFEDVILLLTGMLQEEPRVAAMVRERYRFFNVDEYQDVSPLQHALLKSWLGERTDICVVGDVSQTIYSFAGASSRYLLGFTKEFERARELRLEANYRSTPEIINVANTLIKGKPGALQLHATRQETAHQPRLEWFRDEKEEAAALAEAISNKLGNKLNNSTSAASIAVLYRSNAHALAIEEALRAKKIPFRVQSGMRYFERADVKRAVMEIRAQALAADDRPVFQVVSDVIRGQGWSTKPPEGGSQERERWEVLSALLGLVDEHSKQTLQEFSNELQRRSKSDHEPQLDAVTLATVHSAKGLEWPIVWLYGMSEGSFPISFAKTEAEVAEERRLFYVALTRARDELYLSGSGRGAKKPSRFLAEAKISGSYES